MKIKSYGMKTFAYSALIAAISLSAGHASALVVDSANGLLTMTNDTTVTAAPETASIQTVGSTSNIVSPFTITLDWNGLETAGTGTGPGGATQAAFESAKATWESIITGWKENYTGTTVEIGVSFFNGGVGGVLGSAGPTQVRFATNYIYASQGQMQFDNDDIPGLGSTFEDVVLHEMGHVLGIGTLWSSSGVGIAGYQELYTDGSGTYTGAIGLANYNSEFDQAGASVPVELGGGSGTADGHWNEVDGGGLDTGIVSNITGEDFKNELMTGWLSGETFISTLTAGSFEDLGYNVDYSAIPEPSSLALLGLGGLLFARRRRG